jgi:hypothetical protein
VAAASIIITYWTDTINSLTQGTVRSVSSRGSAKFQHKQKDYVALNFELSTMVKDSGGNDPQGSFELLLNLETFHLQHLRRQRNKAPGSHSYIGSGFLDLLDREHPKEAVIYNRVDCSIGDIIHAHRGCKD